MRVGNIDHSITPVGKNKGEVVSVLGLPPQVICECLHDHEGSRPGEAHLALDVIAKEVRAHERNRESFVEGQRQRLHHQRGKIALEALQAARLHRGIGRRMEEVHGYLEIAPPPALSGLPAVLVFVRAEAARSEARGDLLVTLFSQQAERKANVEVGGTAMGLLTRRGGIDIGLTDSSPGTIPPTITRSSIRSPRIAAMVRQAAVTCSVSSGSIPQPLYGLAATTNRIRSLRRCCAASPRARAGDSGARYACRGCTQRTPSTSCAL